MQEDERNAFLEAIGALRGEVRPLRPHGKVLLQTKKPSGQRRAPAYTPTPLPDHAHAFSDHDPYATENHSPDGSEAQHARFHRPGVAAQTLRRLRQGKLRSDATLDLHGCNRDEARHRLAHLLRQSAAQRYPGEPLCIRIVHGQGLHSPQGRGKLRRLLQIWLAQSPRVLAFCPAQPSDGGQGAMYVLLRAAP